MTEEIRPRFGMVHRADGPDEPVVFYPVIGDPLKFYPVYASDELPVVLGRKDTLSIDVLGPQQTVCLAFTPNR